MRSIVLPGYEVCVEYACVESLRSRLKQEFKLTEPSLNRFALAIGLEWLARVPQEYAGLVLIHYSGIAAHFIGYNPGAFLEYRNFIESHRPLPFAAGSPLLFESRPPDKVRKSHWPSLRSTLMLLLTLGLVGAGIRYLFSTRFPAPDLAVAVLAATSFHASLLLTAMLAVGIPRYLPPLWPAVAVAFAGWWLVRAGLLARVEGRGSRREGAISNTP